MVCVLWRTTCSLFERTSSAHHIAGSPILTFSGHRRSVAPGDFSGVMAVVGSDRGTRFTALLPRFSDSTLFGLKCRQLAHMLTPRSRASQGSGNREYPVQLCETELFASLELLSGVNKRCLRMDLRSEGLRHCFRRFLLHERWGAVSGLSLAVLALRLLCRF